MRWNPFLLNESIRTNCGTRANRHYSARSAKQLTALPRIQTLHRLYRQRTAGFILISFHFTALLTKQELPSDALNVTTDTLHGERKALTAQIPAELHKTDGTHTPFDIQQLPRPAVDLMIPKRQKLPFRSPGELR